MSAGVLGRGQPCFSLVAVSWALLLGFSGTPVSQL